jgi:hypothetical protein
VAAVAAAGLLLSGCGSSLGIHPGAAVIVGSESVSMGTIDSTTTSFCQAYLAQPAQSGQGPSAVPMGLLRSYAATSLAKRALGKQIADAYDVQPAAGYQQALSQYQQSFASSPADQRDAAIAVAGADAYLQNVQVSVGEKLTGNTGATNQVVKANLQRGQVATSDWFGAHNAFMDPVFGVEVDGGKFTPQRGQTSYALSTLASQGAQVSLSSQQGPPAAYTAALPPSQVCAP